MGISLDGKVAVVTGGASGIGRATVEAFADAGARVAIADVTPDAGAALVSALEAQGREVVYIDTDVTRASAVEALFDAVMTRWGRLDCAFNNAGVADQPLFTIDATEENFDRVTAVNLKGVWLCLRRELKEMARAGGGSIVNTASVAGLVGWRGAAVYSATKHGVIGLTRSAALEYARDGVRVNAVCPGVIDTPMGASATQAVGKVHDMMLAKHPQGRFGTPMEVARAVLWLCSEESSFTTGHALTVDGGYVVR
ncbi:MAG: SDR family oxidoreductase [Gammaproteobacteria bacterium]